MREVFSVLCLSQGEYSEVLRYHGSAEYNLLRTHDVLSVVGFLLYANSVSCTYRVQPRLHQWLIRRDLITQHLSSGR